MATKCYTSILKIKEKKGKEIGRSQEKKKIINKKKTMKINLRKIGTNLNE